MTTIPTPPAGLGEAGLDLWHAVVDRFEVEPHELRLLVETCRVADACAELQRAVDSAGLLDGEGRASAALVELRQERVLLSRLLVSLRVPLSDEGAVKRPQRRGGSRGAYLKGVPA